MFYKQQFNDIIVCKTFLFKEDMEEINNKELIRLENVWFSYPSNPVLKDINFTIYKGDFAGIVGKNGSGKTTLLKIILNQLKPQDGKVYLVDNIKIGYVEQVTLNSDSSFPANVYEIVMLGLYRKMKKFHFANIHHKKMIQSALNMVGLDGFEKKSFSLLSGGQQQRVVIAKALVSNPDLLILDEPTTGIDQKSEKDFFELLNHLNVVHQKTILLVTHNIEKLNNTNKIFEVIDGTVKEKENVKL